MLDSRYAMWLGWGPNLTFLYNDAYAKMTLGPKHPWALGRSAREVWREIWNDIGPRAEAVLRTGQATWDEGLLLFLERMGFPEETYHTFSYSPVPDDKGAIGGMLCVVTEDTERTIGERRLRTLRELSARTNEETKSVEETCRITARDSRVPIPMTCRSRCCICWMPQTGRLTSRQSPASSVRPRPVLAVWNWAPHKTRGRLSVVRHTGAALEWSDLPRHGRSPSSGSMAGAAQAGRGVAGRQTRTGAAYGVSGRRASARVVHSTKAIEGFLDMLAAQVASAIGNARAYEEERKRAEALAELDRAKTIFFSNVSHEFRTPLTLMLDPLVEALRDPVSTTDPAHKERLEFAYRNSRRLLKLVNSLLDFSRIEGGRMEASYEPTDVATVTAELAGVFRSAMEQARLILHVDCSAALGAGLCRPRHVGKDCPQSAEQCL